MQIELPPPEVHDRNNILTVFRADIERSINKADILNILDMASLDYETITLNYDEKANLTYFNMKKEIREYFITNTLERFRSARLVLTDRFHGVLFALLTDTPCIVFRNSYHKLEESIKWFRDNENILFIDNNETILTSIEKMISSPIKPCHFALSHFDDFYNRIKNFLNK